MDQDSNQDRPIISPGVFEEIAAERLYQAVKFGGGSLDALDKMDDEYNDPAAFTAYIAHHSTRWLPGTFPPFDQPEVLADFRKQMIKVAALAVVAVGWVDRKTS